MDNVGAFPLGAGDEDGAYAAFGGEVFFEPFDVGFLSRKGDAGAGVDAVLEHLVAVVYQVVAEVGGGFALFFGADGEVECDD